MTGRKFTILWGKLFTKAIGSILRHGPVNVAKFVHARARRRNLKWVMDYALADSTTRSVLLTGELALVEGSGVAVSITDARRIEAETVAFAPPTTTMGAWSLDADYSIDPNVWDAYLGPLFSRSILDPISQLPPPNIPDLCIVVEGDASNEGMLRQTTDAIARVAAASQFRITARIISSNNTELLNKYFERAVASRVEALEGLPLTSLVLWLRVGDAPRPELSPAMLLYLQPDVDILTFDGYFYDFGRVHPVFLPGANAPHAMNVDYFYSRFLMRVAAIDRAALGNTGESLVELVRSWLRRRPSFLVKSGWRHISAPVLHYELSRTAIQDLRVEHMNSDQVYQLDHTGRDVTKARISLIICTKDKGNLLRQLVLNCLKLENVCEIIVVANNASNYFATSTLSDIECHERVEVVRYDAPFNFSAQSNLGVKAAKGDFLLLLNDDIVPVTPDWLDRLIEPFQDPVVGMTAPLLLYPNEKVQHAGMYLGLNACAGHALRFATLPDQDYLFYASAPRETSALTGAVLLISRECYEAMNGLDELLPTFLQDVDFCLRARDSGFKSIFIPSARLFHMESMSVIDHISKYDVAENRGREHAYFFNRWKGELGRDPFHSANFDLQEESMRVLRAPSS